MTSAIVALDHVQVAAPAACEEAARRFYGTLLGLDEVAKPEGVAATGGVWFRCGKQELHIGVDPAFRPARKAHPALLAADDDALDALARGLTEAGVEVQWDERIESVRRFYAFDPWGNRLELRS